MIMIEFNTPEVLIRGEIWGTILISFQSKYFELERMRRSMFRTNQGQKATLEVAAGELRGNTDSCATEINLLTSVCDCAALDMKTNRKGGPCLGERHLLPSTKSRAPGIIGTVNSLILPPKIIKNIFTRFQTLQSFRQENKASTLGKTTII